MILTLGFRGIYRQEQYETVTVEGSVTVSSCDDPEWFTGSDPVPAMRSELIRLLAPWVSAAAATSRYGHDETVVYEWEGIINDTAGDPPPQRRQGRRVRRD